MTARAPTDSEPGTARERIIDAARAEFAARGRSASSVRTIAARAGVTAAMINYHFGGKRALHDLIVEQAQANLQSRFFSAFVDAEPSEVPSRLAAAYFDFLVEEHDFQRLILREVLDSSEGLSGYAERYIAPLGVLFKRRFGDHDATVQAAISLFGAIAGYFLYGSVLSELLEEDPMSPERLAARRRHVMALAEHLTEDLGDGPSERSRR